MFTSDRGIVFDIQRASLHDGPGLRTTVFLKGCGLRCAWCHNPESQALRPELGFDAARCVSCGACVAACAQQVHAIDAAGVHRVDFGACIVAGDCIPACPTGALRLYGAESTVASIMAEVLKDRVYYAASGGGLTISGGEPTVQLDFCLSLLRAAREAGIHTCVETCGFTAREGYEAILPLVDLFLFDYKATSVERHVALTDGSNVRILSNLRWLHDHGACIRLRCPMLPGVNDDASHLEAIARLSVELPRLQAIELLPYHNSGDGKYDRLGRPRPNLGTQVPEPALREAWRAAIVQAGACVPVSVG